LLRAEHEHEHVRWALHAVSKNEVDAKAADAVAAKVRASSGRRKTCATLIETGSIRRPGSPQADLDKRLCRAEPMQAHRPMHIDPGTTPGLGS